MSEELPLNVVEYALRATAHQFGLLDVSRLFSTGRSTLWMMPLHRSFDSAPELDPAIRRAGTIWLRNYDFAITRELVIFVPFLGSAYLFRRPMQPGEQQLSVGPIPVREPREWSPIPASPLSYWER
jgi:hypothetical protein